MASDTHCTQSECFNQILSVSFRAYLRRRSSVFSAGCLTVRRSLASLCALYEADH